MITRSLKKIPFKAKHLLRKIEKIKKLNTKAEKKIIITWFQAINYYTQNEWPYYQYNGLFSNSPK